MLNDYSFSSLSKCSLNIQATNPEANETLRILVAQIGIRQVLLFLKHVILEMI